MQLDPHLDFVTQLSKCGKTWSLSSTFRSVLESTSARDCSGWFGTPQRLDYTAIGDSVNTAKRIQENAEADQILISAEAKKLLGKNVELKAAEAIDAKGKKELVKVFELVGLA